MRFRSISKLLAACGLLGVFACDDEAPGGTADADAAASDGGDTATGDVGDDQNDAAIAPVSCEPTPERCDALGTERPGRLSEHGAAYDTERLEMVIYGGSSAIPQGCDIASPIYSDQTWMYDDPCGAWTLVDVPGPGPRSRHMMTWGGGDTYLFGGRYRDPGADPLSTPYTLYDDLWRFDGATRTWEAVPTSGERPPARVNGAFVWDSSRQALWLYGGNTSNRGTSYIPAPDVWRFDMAESRWTEIEPSGDEPEPRLFHGALYDATRDALVIHGGADETAFDFENPVFYFRDIWALDLENESWTQLDSGTEGPDGRFWASLVHDAESDRYLLFGGHDDASLGNRNDTWAFDPDGGWSELTTGDTLFNTNADPCDLPPDFATVDLAVPERRNAHVMVWSAPCGRGTLFGGKTDCGASDDVWHLDATGWTEQLSATVGEVCHRWRPNPDNCANLCL